MRINKNLLYIGDVPSKIMTGKDVANKHCYLILDKIFGEKCRVINLGLPSLFEKICLYSGGLTREIECKILELIDVNDIDVVFLSTSALGRVARCIKKRYPNVMIISFYHNIEKFYAKEQIKVSGIKRAFTYINLSFNEFLMSQYADFHVVLNKRDASLLNQYYGKEADLIVPINYEDRFIEGFSKTYNNNPKVALFVGSAFFANIEGMRWFLKEVKPFINSRLIIVGKGMEKYEEEFRCDGVDVFGFVENLDELYVQADFVVLPIFSGGGMKTKTAEALMFGKTVLGTKEAFEGYENMNESFAIECNDSTSFLDAIKNIEKTASGNVFNTEARSYYLRECSFDAVMCKWNTFFTNILYEKAK